MERLATTLRTSRAFATLRDVLLSKFISGELLEKDAKKRIESAL